MIDVRCPTCHREERWTLEAGVPAAVEVRLEGGNRRPAVHPQWERGRVALRAARGAFRVVGVCEACGHLLVTEGPGPKRMPVQIDTPFGRLHVDGADVRGPQGAMSVDDADAWLADQYREPLLKGVGADLLKLPFFIGVLGPFVLFLLSMVSVIMFLITLYEGAPPAVQGAAGFDRTQPW